MESMSHHGSRAGRARPYRRHALSRSRSLWSRSRCRRRSRSQTHHETCAPDLLGNFCPLVVELTELHAMLRLHQLDSLSILGHLAPTSGQHLALTIAPAVLDIFDPAQLCRDPAVQTSSPIAVDALRSFELLRLPLLPLALDELAGGRSLLVDHGPARRHGSRDPGGRIDGDRTPGHQLGRTSWRERVCQDV